MISWPFSKKMSEFGKNKTHDTFLPNTIVPLQDLPLSSKDGMCHPLTSLLRNMYIVSTLICICLAMMVKKKFTKNTKSHVYNKATAMRNDCRSQESKNIYSEQQKAVRAREMAA